MYCKYFSLFHSAIWFFLSKPSGFLFLSCFYRFLWVGYIQHPKVHGHIPKCFVKSVTFSFSIVYVVLVTQKNITTKLRGGYIEATAASQIGTFPSRRCSGNRLNRGVKFSCKNFFKVAKIWRV